MKIFVKITLVYGKEMIYPDCHDSKLFAEIAGTKTLSMDDISKIKQLGYTVAVRKNHADEL